MRLYIALISDANGYYCHVWGKALSWHHFLNQLKDVGCEVIENQTDDHDGWNDDEIMEDYISIDQLINHPDYVAHK